MTDPKHDQAASPNGSALSDLLGLAAFRPVAWVRKHPDGTLTDELLPDARIEACRTESGAWEPLYTRSAAARALAHANNVLEHNTELLVQRDAMRADVLRELLEWEAEYMRQARGGDRSGRSDARADAAREIHDHLSSSWGTRDLLSGPNAAGKAHP